MLKLSPPLWALLFVAAAAGASWMLGWPAIPVPRHDRIGVVLFFAAWILPVWAFHTLRREGTEVDPLSETNAKLVTRGPYRFSRNPMYLGLTFATLGLAVWVGAWPMLAVPVLVFATAAFVHVPFEEAKMGRQFGAQYQAYVGRVRRWL